MRGKRIPGNDLDSTVVDTAGEVTRDPLTVYTLGDTVSNCVCGVETLSGATEIAKAVRIDSTSIASSGFGARSRRCCIRVRSRSTSQRREQWRYATEVATIGDRECHRREIALRSRRDRAEITLRSRPRSGLLCIKCCTVCKCSTIRKCGMRRR